MVTHAQSPTPSLDISSLKELKIEESRKNDTGKLFQIGDRIPLFISIPQDLASASDTLELRAPETGNKIEDQGWYLDNSHQFENGVFRFIVSPIQTGNLSLPTLIIYKNKDTPIARTSVYGIQVDGPKTKSEQPPELLDVTAISIPLKYIFILILLAALFVVGAIFIYQKFIKKPPKPAIIVPPVLEPAHRIALRKLQQAYEKYPYSISNLKPASFLISELLKEFFSSRFKVDARESTTQEMLLLLRREAVSEESLREINRIFVDLDLMKFTKTENYEHISNEKYQELKIQTEQVIMKWALAGDRQ